MCEDLRLQERVLPGKGVGELAAGLDKGCLGA